MLWYGLRYHCFYSFIDIVSECCEIFRYDPEQNIPLHSLIYLIFCIYFQNVLRVRTGNELRDKGGFLETQLTFHVREEVSLLKNKEKITN